MLGCVLLLFIKTSINNTVLFGFIS